MTSKKRLSQILILFLVLINVGCDQLTKKVVRQHLSYGEHLTVIKDYFTIVKVENTGAFLSSGESLPSPVKFVLLNLLPLLVIGYGLYFLMTNRHLDRWLVFGMACIMGGGLGNLYDRMVYGSVTDFMHMNFVVFQTGVFNVADLSISSGLLMVLFSIYYKKVSPARAAK